MKNFFKKIPTFAVISLIIVLTVVVAVFATNSTHGDINGKDGVNDDDVVAILDSIVGKEGNVGNLAEFDGKEGINVLDAIALKRYIFMLGQDSDGYTTFWY